ncbi:hypothetical protein OHA72_51685 [Dactylosporangium sp. NBC_01737]|nr:hypothetical protein OHA72_51685 [Dactylosporangium sp. NBC_01737]
MDLLDSDDRTLFAAAVRRITQPDDAARPLLEALALALGRGLPRAGRIWLSVAGALTEASFGEDAIDRLLREAAPYVLLDAEHGQSVYRLAHHSFTTFLIGDGHADRHRRVTEALVRAAAADLPRPPHPYLVRYLAGHAARAQAWQELERHPDLLDHLEPAGVAAEVLRSAFGRADLPPQVAATLMTHHLLAAVPPGDRASVRAVAAARLRPDPPPVEPNRGLPPHEPHDSGLSLNTWSAGATDGQRWQVGARSVVLVRTPPPHARRTVPPADGGRPRPAARCDGRGSPPPRRTSFWPVTAAPWRPSPPCRCRTAAPCWRARATTARCGCGIRSPPAPSASR